MEFLLVSDVARKGMMLMLMTMMMGMNMFTFTFTQMLMLMITVFFRLRMEIPQVCVLQFNASLILVDFLNCL